MSKLTYEDKIEIYYKKKNGQSRYSLVKEYHIRDCNISYLIRLIDKHGFDRLRKNQNKKYSKYEKEETINRVLLNGESKIEVAIDMGLSGDGMIENFFGLLKTEMLYDQEDKYKNIDELIIVIDEYINYYNYDRIKVKLKGLSPVNYRLQSSN